jgi:class 3 adenylate cyclase
MALITMMFTDVVESSATKRDTSLGRDNRERDRAYLTQVQTPHFELVRACCKAHGGQEVSNTGDAFFLTFEDPTAAVRCAASIQERLARTPIDTPAGPLRLRIGIHSGFPEFFEGSWHGTDVDTAARVASTATERQILVSSRTYELVRQMTDVKFHSRGEFAMKGVERMVLWEADWDGKGPRPTAVRPLDVGRRRKRNLSIAGAVAGTMLVVAAGIYFYRSYSSGRVSMPLNNRPTVAVVGFKNRCGAHDISGGCFDSEDGSGARDCSDLQQRYLIENPRHSAFGIRDFGGLRSDGKRRRRLHPY